ncbi:ankyrin repeat and LEM domain-containing protein 1 isoform X1 [Hypomesus transpacificus]|uniref:ankyrin repeat and LEM domain-containing protein 1 isoform X1 n=1 Tax=Hypomesus transpacificus TaxID=137520 RepID=UPI001F0746F2|nr:ankyrin repeat and LEM domain-containing protein 1 isoform X1 [Hypomesus transpacificus]
MHRNKSRDLATQLCNAVNDGDSRAVQILLSQGANPNSINNNGVAAVHLAVGKESEKNTRCLKLILQYGADPNLRSSDGLTPLHVAALWGCYQNLKLLLKNGGNPHLKDQEGNKPGDLAHQQDNRKCASLLQEYQSTSLDTEEEDLPQFQYSVYNGEADTSSYAETTDDCSVQSLSLLSDFGEGPLSSTRCSFLDLSAIRRPSLREGDLSRPSDVKPNVGPSKTWDIDSEWKTEAPSMLSSTRMSVAGSKTTLPRLKEGVLLTDYSVIPTQDVGYVQVGNAATPLETLPPFPRASRKSVSFKDVDEYFPVFSSESPRGHHAVPESPATKDCSLDLSEYSGFLNSDRMATVLHRHGIDVTSPDHVFAFSRDAHDFTAEDMEKTVLGHLLPEEENEDEKGHGLGEEVKADERPACSTGTSSSSSSRSSQYSSCESDYYMSALDASVHPRLGVICEDEHGIVKSTVVEAGNDNYKTNANLHTDGFRQGIGSPVVITEAPKYPSSKMTGADKYPAIDKLTLSEKRSPTKLSEMNSGPEGKVAGAVSGTAEEKRATQPVQCTPVAGAAAAACEDEFDVFTPSPFVTGRTRSRLSRCSLRTSRTLENSTLSLFEQSLVTPTRTRRDRTKSQSSDGVFCDTPGRCPTPVYPGSSDGSTAWSSVDQETQSGSLPDGSCLSASQVDTIIIPKSASQRTGSYGVSQADTLRISNSMSDAVIKPQALADTVLLERGEEEEMSTDSGNHHADPWLAHLRKEIREACPFLTDDTSSSDTGIKEPGRSTALVEPVGGLKRDEEPSWTTEDSDSQPESSQSTSSTSRTLSSSSSYFSPKRSRDDTPLTPGTGCTPRYSMSRLSGLHKPRCLSDLSYTPGGRPLIQDLEEPVEYLYTDTEQGHELIETHVPPTANTSLSSSVSSEGDEDTVLYDWRSMHGGLTKGKENRKPVDEKLPNTEGLTDRELRRRLLELGESPGPITSRTRPVYMQRLQRMILEPSPMPKFQAQNPDQLQTVMSGHSPELCRALQTLELPDCQADELALCQQFDQADQNRKWREGVIKSSFNYLLLDPRVTKNLPYRSHSMTPLECFQTFIGSIFYIGKGKRSRPYSHLYEALEYFRGDKTSKKLCTKVQHILQVWKAGQGVISLHCFQNVIPVEAYTREACMVDAIGLKMLTNQKRGDYYGVVSTWQVKRKKELGVRLLYRAMNIFLAEGERQLRPADIRAGQ